MKGNTFKAVRASFGNRRSASEQRHQRTVLIVLCCTIIPITSVFSVAAWSRGIYWVSIFEICYGLTAALMLARRHRIKDHQAALLVLTLPVFVALSFVIMHPKSSATVFVWVFAMPLVAYAAHGVRLGFLLTGLVYLATGLQFALYKINETAYQDPVAQLNVIVCALAIWFFAHIVESARAGAQRELERIAASDPLTGLLNRLRLDDIYQQLCHRASWLDRQPALVMIDLDHFKAINDTLGHDAGDLVLCRVAGVLKRAVRSDDQVFRLGGEEFCVMGLLRDQNELALLAEALRAEIEAAVIHFRGERLQVTASLGAVLGEYGENLDELLTEADRRLYQAKRGGRNRVIDDNSAIAA